MYYKLTTKKHELLQALINNFAKKLHNMHSCNYADTSKFRKQTEAEKTNFTIMNLAQTQ